MHFLVVLIELLRLKENELWRWTARFNDKVLRWKRFWLPTRVTVYLHRTFRHQVCFVSWKVPEMNHCPLCGSRKPLWTDRQWAEQERVGPGGSDSVKVTPETCSVLSDTGNITTLCFLYKPFSLGPESSIFLRTSSAVWVGLKLQGHKGYIFLRCAKV